MRTLLLSLILISVLSAAGQCKTYRLGEKRDTLDCVDTKGMKQGRWIVRVPPLRGEPGYEEEGIFINNRKEGVWKRFNTMGDPLAVETYKWGNRNGKCLYFTIAGIEREENWRAVNPDKVFDTIDVVDPKDPNKYEKVIVKNEGRSLKHGVWRYFNPNTGALMQTEKYILDQLQTDEAPSVTQGMTKVGTDTARTKAAAVPEKPKPREVLEFEKKNAGKKTRVRDGRTGG
ncbi:toxin-antitoxin system YwqK family antitoxin [Sediminibacterium soli]|uniref:hypothetical protein n=1 Tax=Sediminibacterium soli TaxID=2698829 RepID=UPI00137AFECF|nr:hypothetical protein [Sediminibacterium soli]NCI46922.1 hypothetical protein [Sediminibacterium soli]